jgi:hypothetical protein
MVRISSSGAAIKPQELRHGREPNRRSWGILERFRTRYIRDRRKTQRIEVSRREEGCRASQKNRAPQRPRQRLFFFSLPNGNNAEQQRLRNNDQETNGNINKNNAQSPKKRQGKRNGF